MAVYIATCGLFYLFLCGGSLAAAAWGKRPFGKTLPFFLFLSVIIVYASAVFGDLYLGGTIALLIGFGLLLFGVAALICKRDGALRQVLSPAWSVFTFLFVLLCICNYERKIWYADDFRHWATVVKAMVQQNVLGSDAAARLTHSNYPPAMAIIQYLAERLQMLVSPRAEFSDALLYVANETAIVALFVPFLPQRFEGTRMLPRLIGCLFAVLTIALAFSPLVLSVVMIDGFLGLLFGCGAAMLIRMNTSQREDRLFFCFLLAVLTLTKNTGIPFAVTLLAAALFLPKMGWNDRMRMAVGGTASVALPYLAWQHLLAVGAGTQKFSDPVSISAVWEILCGRGDAFQKEVFSLYFKKLLFAPIQKGEIGIGLTFVVIMAVFAAAFVLLYFARKKTSRQLAARTAAVSAWLWGLSCLYALCLPFAYLFLFSKAEAETVIMWDRYLSIPLSGMLFLLSVLILDDTLPSFRRQKVVAIWLLGVLFLITPWREPVRFLTRYATRQSQQLYSAYAAAVESATAGVEDLSESSVLIIMQASEISGQDGEGIKYNLRPAEANLMRLSTEYRCMDRADGSTEAEAFQQLLLQREYDYVLLYRLDDYFVDTYAAAFVDSAKMMPNTLLRVNPMSGRLE